MRTGGSKSWPRSNRSTTQPSRWPDGRRAKPDAVIVATGYRRGVAPLVGHLGVLDDHGLPRVHGGDPAAPGLRFIGFEPRPAQISHLGREATRAARAIAQETSSAWLAASRAG